MKNRKNICTQIGDLLYFKSEKYFLLSWTHSAILKSVSSASSCVSQAIKDVLSQYEDERAAKYEDLPGVKQPGEFFDDEKVETRPQRERTLDD